MVKKFPDGPRGKNPRVGKTSAASSVSSARKETAEIGTQTDRVPKTWVDIKKAPKYMAVKEESPLTLGAE